MYYFDVYEESIYFLVLFYMGCTPATLPLILTFVGDIILISNNVNNRGVLITNLESNLQAIGLYLNMDKTEVIIKAFLQPNKSFKER